MSQELKCPKCGAHYKKTVPEWVTCVQCEYCRTAILVQRKNSDSRGSERVVVKEIVRETVEKPPKVFCLTEFSEFMRQKGYALDPVSGLLKLGQIMISISEGGVVEGPEPYRTRAERWLTEYMKK
jgi:DNA-directed RNA polymerase subunit RPC12/RpoP